MVKSTSHWYFRRDEFESFIPPMSRDCRIDPPGLTLSLDH
jgi:hypothetical protein